MVHDDNTVSVIPIPDKLKMIAVFVKYPALEWLKFHLLPLKLPQHPHVPNCMSRINKQKATK